MACCGWVSGLGGNGWVCVDGRVSGWVGGRPCCTYEPWSYRPRWLALYFAKQWRPAGVSVTLPEGGRHDHPITIAMVALSMLATNNPELPRAKKITRKSRARKQAGDVAAAAIIAMGAAVVGARLPRGAAATLQVPLQLLERTYQQSTNAAKTPKCIEKRPVKCGGNRM